MDKRIAVIMSTYNESDFELSASIDSVLNQTFEDFEFIIVNDNPDNTKIEHLLQKYKNLDRRIRVIQNKENIGLAASLNAGIATSSAEYIARQDADDISLPERFQIQVDYLEANANCALVCANRIDIDEESELLGTGTNFTLPDDKIKKIMPYGSVIIHPTVMMRKQVVEKLGGYRNLRSGQDYDLWLRMIAAGYNIHILPEVLLKYRIRKNSISKINFAKQYFSSKYAAESYKMLIQKGEDAFNEFTYDNFVTKNHVDNAEYMESLNSLYNDVHSLSREHGFKQILGVFCGLVRYPEMIRFLKKGIIYKIMLMIYSKSSKLSSMIECIYKIHSETLPRKAKKSKETVKK